MAASIPVLRTLIRRRENPKPARFIELGDNRLKVRSGAAAEEGQAQQHSQTDPAVTTDVSGGRRSGEEGETEWTPTAVTKVCHSETLRGRRRDGEAGGMPAGEGSIEQLTDGLGVAR